MTALIGFDPVTRPPVAPTVENGQEVATSQPWGDVNQAVAYEEAIRAEAENVWAGQCNHVLTRGLFVRLYPLLRLPIHPGHLVATSRAAGKPYESDGVCSVQVLVDRMHNVLTPMWWRQTREYEQGGRLCRVVVVVVDSEGNVLAEGESWGGMNWGSTVGNLWKGSYTNAAKVAFARLGPGHEIYSRSTDYDPDTRPDALDDQNRGALAAAEASVPREPDSKRAERLERLLGRVDVAGTWGITDAKVKMMLVSAGAEDTASIAVGIDTLNAERAAEFEFTLNGAIASAEWDRAVPAGSA